MGELEEKQEEATKMRKEEKSENSVNVMEATAGLEAVEQAIDILDKFYKTAAKEGVDLELVQKGPLDDMPDAGFAGGPTSLRRLLRLLTCSDDGAGAPLQPEMTAS